MSIIKMVQGRSCHRCDDAFVYLCFCDHRYTSANFLAYSDFFTSFKHIFKHCIRKPPLAVKLVAASACPGRTVHFKPWPTCSLPDAHSATRPPPHPNMCTCVCTHQNSPVLSLFPFLSLPRQYGKALEERAVHPPIHPHGHFGKKNFDKKTLASWKNRKGWWADPPPSHPRWGHTPPPQDGV